MKIIIGIGLVQSTIKITLDIFMVFGNYIKKSESLKNQRLCSTLHCIHAHYT